ncbi:formimidoylglutamase [Corynebacterium sp. zg-331]|uniref:formimidoylglutamase n=1 Tax=unclassified Corynebacterium TaxID=2624378 RepID=UPI00128C5105|nr:MULTISPECIES: formimidoylglutamase [unclassified Corynebacterium]MBC3185022.1 formimidoylglutamase [Corynebacterium sp. zg-331]MPV51522.1 formimidoylglutamase [Corynebacterium sp. zg331]
MTLPGIDIAPAAWTGRNDGPGPEHARWHSVVQPLDSADATPGVALLGFRSDEGVRRNGGRQGAAEAPRALRAALGSLAVHDDLPRYDAGDVVTAGTDLESAQERVSEVVAALTQGGHTVIALGGGHETAWATHRGLRRTHPQGVQIVNLDAHFDLRRAEWPTSGTPFLQIAEHVGEDFRYSVLGISRPNNTRVLFDTARELGVQVRTDDELAALGPQDAAALVTEAADTADHLHLSIDLDGLPAAVAPGVSAPAAVGVSLAAYRAMVRAAAASGKLRLVDVAELNPRFDVDGRTARVAARLIDDIVAALV